jgi:glycosyltransferase involved in cell wall biosynthesis
MEARMMVPVGNRSDAPGGTPADGAELELSIVMPCLNEAETLETCIVKAKRFLTEQGISGEVVIADNGSTDGSQEIARRLGARLVPVAAKGYGHALMGGITASHGRFVIMGDADDSYDFTNLMPFVEKMRDGYELVMGNRFRGGIRPGAMPWHHKYIGNPVLTTLGRVLFRSPCKDFHCGLRGFRRDSALALDLRTGGMEFASEMVVKATLHKQRVTEVPTILSPDGRSRPPHLRSWRDGWRHLRFLLLYSPGWLFLFPGLLLVLLGLLAGAWLLPGPRMVGRVHFDIHTLMYAAAAILVGFQAVTFAFFTKTFAISEGLLPHDPKLTRAFRFITLETGLIAGAVILLAGVVWTVLALTGWETKSFGDLDPQVTARMVIPAITCLALGAQTIFSSFFLSVLGLTRRGN